MNFFKILIQRIGSKNPILFQYLGWSAFIIGGLCQCLFWIDGYFLFLQEPMRGFLNDLEVGAFSVSGTCAFTTDNKALQRDTNDLLK